MQISFKSSVVFKRSEAILNHLHMIVAILLVIFNCYNIYIYILFLSTIYHDHYIYIYIYIYILDTKKTNSCFLWKSLSMWHWSFYGKKSSRPWFSSTQEAKFQQFPYDFLVRELDREQRPIQCPGRRPWPRCWFVGCSNGQHPYPCENRKDTHRETWWC